MGDVLRLHPVTGTPAELARLQAVLEQAPRYHGLVMGAPAGSGAAREIWETCAPGRPREDKWMVAIVEGGDGSGDSDAPWIGMVDVLPDHPEPGIEWIGLFLIVEPRQGRGVGRHAIALVEDEIRRRGRAHAIRLSVVATNAPALAFWKAVGYRELGIRKPWLRGTVNSETVVFEKRLAAGPAGA